MVMRKVNICICLFWVLYFSVGCSQDSTEMSSELIILGETITDTGEESEIELDMDEGSDQEVASSSVVEGVVSIYVCGAVQVEGVYELPEGSRIYEAIEAAGGATEDAMESYLNLAEVVTDGQKIYVPTKTEVEEGTVISYSDDSGSGSDSGLVNINTASKEELMTLTGIGEAKAESIISYRETEGDFSSPEDIMLITGIKEGVYNQIADEIVAE